MTNANLKTKEEALLKRNVIDFYKYWETEAILADLNKKRHNFTVLCSNLYNDFNLSTIIRNSNAFLAKEVVIYGRKQWDRRGAVGTQNYTNFKYTNNLEDLKDLFNSSVVVGIDNLENSEPIDSFEWPSDRHVVMIFGQEQVGIPDELIAFCDHLVYIRQYGSVRSLNVGCASSIAMYDYVNKVIKQTR